MDDGTPRRKRHDLVIESLEEGMGEAVDTLRRHLRDPAPPAVQVRAAHVLLECGFRQLQLEDLEARVANAEEVQRSRVFAR